MYAVAKKIVPEKINMKDVFGRTMEGLACCDPDVVYFDSDLINSIGMADFSKKFPERTVDCGIQEANMISAASGVSIIISPRDWYDLIRWGTPIIFWPAISVASAFLPSKSNC